MINSRKKEIILQHKFIKNAPDTLEDGVVYVSIEYASVIHKCCCGCGEEVVTPLAPKEWKLTYDGESITLYPSIGNWKFKCRSHYLIINNRVVWPDEFKSTKRHFKTKGAKSNAVPNKPQGKVRKWWWFGFDRGIDN
jgi:hypothetical protein